MWLSPEYQPSAAMSIQRSSWTSTVVCSPARTSTGRETGSYSKPRQTSRRASPTGSVAVKLPSVWK